MKLLKTTVAATALCLSVTTAWGAGLTARVNTDKLAQGDGLQLVLTADGSATPPPDLAPLAQNFEVLGTSQSSQTQIINGRRSQSVSWIVTLSPRTTGKLIIPSLSAGTLSSEPLAVQVVDASQLPKLQGTTGITLSAAIDDSKHYQFQEIPLKVRIETSKAFQSAELAAPTGDFELTQTGQDRQSQITRGGQPITVVERDYLLRPETSGEVRIPPFTLKGAVSDPNARRTAMASPFGGRDPFAMMDQMMARMGGMGSPFGSMAASGAPFVARSDEITLNVLANPDTGSSDWFLPAKAVELRAEWIPGQPVFREGEAVTRKVSILALGARPEQLPDLTFDGPEGARIYLDDVGTDMVETAKGTVARRDFSLSIVPTQGGDVVLPEISVQWLDTASGETQTAVLPSEVVKVEGSPPAFGALVDQPLRDQFQSVGMAAETGGIADQVWRAALLAGGLLLALGVSMVAVRRGTKGQTHSDPSPAVKQPDILRGLRRAAANGDRDGFYAKLLELRTRPQSIAPLRIKDAISVLEKARYAPTDLAAPVDLTALFKDLTVGNSSRRPRPSWGRRDALPALYPRT